MKFVAAQNYTEVTGHPRTIRYLVIHTTESSRRKGAAATVADYFAGLAADPAPMASAHYVGDADEIIQCVRDEDVAWHAPGLNRMAIGIEIVGRASQGREEWLDSCMDELELVAALCADKCKAYGLDIQEVGSAGLLGLGRHIKAPPLTGITTHANVSRAFKKSDHTDPGPGFPMDVLVQMALERAAGARSSPA